MTATDRRNSILPICNFLSKGWEVSILGLLAFVQHDFALPLYMVGMLSTLFIVSQLVVSLFAGRIAHAVRSRNVILLAVAASGASWGALMPPDGMALRWTAYICGGIASGLFEPIGNSLVARASSASKRGASIGNFAAFGDMGRIVMVAAATALAGSFGLRAACMVMLGTSICALVAASALLPPSAPRESAEAEPAHNPAHALLQNRRFRFATFAGVADSFSSASLYIFIPFLLSAKGIALANTLYFNVIFFAGYMLGRLVLGRLADKHGPPVVLIASDITMAAFMMVLTLLQSSALLMATLFVLGIFTRGTSPVIRAMVADSVHGKSSFHDAFSAYSFASRSSGALCRPIYGFLASYAGIASVFYVAAAVSLVTVYPAARYRGETTIEA